MPSQFPSHAPTTPPTELPTSSEPTNAPSQPPSLAPTVDPCRVNGCSADCVVEPCGWNSQESSCETGYVTITAERVALLETRPGDCSMYTVAPTKAPSSSAPTSGPTDAPSTGPTQQPTTAPTSTSPSHLPSQVPTGKPTSSAPTTPPTYSPSTAPSAAPSTPEPSSAPSSQPTRSPTPSPTPAPSTSPSLQPTMLPSVAPTTQPSPSPTTPPSPNPSATPTRTIACGVPDADGVAQISFGDLQACRTLSAELRDLIDDCHRDGSLSGLGAPPDWEPLLECEELAGPGSNVVLHPGCRSDHHTVEAINTVLQPYRTVAGRGTPSILQVDGTCPRDEQVIESAEECHTAAVLLGIDQDPQELIGRQPSLPTGCYVKRSTGRLYYNADGTRVYPHVDRISFCRNIVQVPTTIFSAVFTCTNDTVGLSAWPGLCETGVVFDALSQAAVDQSEGNFQCVPADIASTDATTTTVTGTTNIPSTSVVATSAVDGIPTSTPTPPVPSSVEVQQTIAMMTSTVSTPGTLSLATTVPVVPTTTPATICREDSWFCGHMDLSFCEFSAMVASCPHRCGRCTSTVQATVEVATTDALPTSVTTETCTQRRTEAGAVCQCGADCHSCEYSTMEGTGRCTRCRNSQYLASNGDCVSACPTGSVGEGNGRYRRRCVLLTACIPRRDDCHVCNPNLTVCTKCRNSQSLHQGVCISSGECEAMGLIVRGQGRYSRICLADTSTIQADVQQPTTVPEVTATSMVVSTASITTSLHTEIECQDNNDGFAQTTRSHGFNIGRCEESLVHCGGPYALSVLRVAMGVHCRASCNLCEVRSVNSGGDGDDDADSSGSDDTTTSPLETATQGIAGTSAEPGVSTASTRVDTTAATDSGSASGGCQDSDADWDEVAASYGFNLARCDLALVHCPGGPFALTVLRNAMAIHCRASCSLCGSDVETGAAETTSDSTAFISASPVMSTDLNTAAATAEPSNATSTAGDDGDQITIPSVTAPTATGGLMSTAAVDVTAADATSITTATDSGSASGGCQDSDADWDVVAASYGFNLARCNLALVHCPGGPFALTVLRNAMAIHCRASCSLCGSDVETVVTSTAIDSTTMAWSAGASETTATSAAATETAATTTATDASVDSCDDSDEDLAQIAAGHGFNLAQCELALVHCPGGPFAMTVIMNAMAIHCRRACSLCDEDDSATVDTTEAAIAGTSAPETSTTSTPPALVCRGGRTDNDDLCDCHSDCHTCSFAQGQAGTCTKCRNQQALFEGDCISTTACEALGLSVNGRGTFNRLCR